ncbi:MAG: AAA family ATPase [Candidatus Methanomethylophilaceae archaeon]|nr:AAA family ATPase [Candidatus Methanomethylophilaceae archaeon]
MEKPFIGRHAELSILEKEYAEGSGVITIAGRSGVGKTRLLREFSRNRNVLHFTASPLNDRMLLGEFDRAVSAYCGKRPGSSRSWYDAFDLFSSHSDNLRVLILDDFQDLTVSSGFLSELRDSWDNLLSQGNILLILCGSVVSSMEQMGSDMENPMFGTVKRSIVLEPLAFDEMPEGEFSEKLLSYSLHGGIPGVMSLLSGMKDPEEMFSVLSDPDSPAFNRVTDALSSEVKGVQVYLSIMKAIADGMNRITQISEAVGIPPTTLNAYLRKLLDNGAVRRTVPATDYFPEKSKSGIYSIADHNTLFWLRFILPHLSDIGMREFRVARKDFLDNHMEVLVRPAYRDICIGKLQSFTDDIGFMPIVYGLYWNMEMDMDIIALNPAKKRALVARCFCRGSKVGRIDLNALIRAAGRINELRGYIVKLGMFSTDGFDEDLMAEQNILLVHGLTAVGKRSEGVLDKDPGI